MIDMSITKNRIVVALPGHYSALELKSNYEKNNTERLVSMSRVLRITYQILGVSSEGQALNDSWLDGPALD